MAEDSGRSILKGIAPIRTNAVILIVLATLFSVWAISIDELRPYAMTLGGGMVTGLVAVGIVFAGKSTAVVSKWASPFDVNVIVTVLGIGWIVFSLLTSTLRKGDFITSALDALVGAVVVGVVSLIMAFAKKDTD